MKSYKRLGNSWYLSKVSIFKKILDKIIWFGGWWSPNWDNGVYTYKFNPFRDPLPVSIFKRFDIQLFGFSLELKKGYLCWHWYRRVGIGKSYCYFSPNGTPDKAVIWYWGTPKKIKDNIMKPADCGGKKITEKQYQELYEL